MDPFVRSVECAEFEHQQGGQPTLSHAVQKVEHEQSAHLLKELEILHCFLVPKLTADYQEGYRALLQSQYHKNSGAKMLAMICGTVALMSSSIRYQIWRPNSPAADTTFRIRMVRAHVPILIPIYKQYFQYSWQNLTENSQTLPRERIAISSIVRQAKQPIPSYITTTGINYNIKAVMRRNASYTAVGKRQDLSESKVSEQPYHRFIYINE